MAENKKDIVPDPVTNQSISNASTSHTPVVPALPADTSTAEKVGVEGKGVLEEDRTCRFCFETEADSPGLSWVRPCKCKGSMANVHQKCLNEWVWMSHGDACKCSVCGYTYKWHRGELRTAEQCWDMLCNDYETSEPLFWIPEIWAINAAIIMYTASKQGVDGVQQMWGDKWYTGMTVWMTEALILFIPALHGHHEYVMRLWNRMHTLSFEECH